MYGRVYEAVHKADKNNKVAIKVLDKMHLIDQLDAIEQEIAILQKLDHPNIVNYFETYDDKKYLYLVMEHVKGMELFEKIEKETNFNEKTAAKYMLQMFKAINHLHAQGIVHRDIKPENVMVTENDEIRLIDFGLSKVQVTEFLNERAGTPYYVAPEVIERKYGKQADIWSLGVILYQLVSGLIPFDADSPDALFKKIKNCEWSFVMP